MSKKIIALRIVHGLFATYFVLCLAYVYIAAFTGRFEVLLLIAIVSLALEGIAVFILNQGDCPLIHIQRRIGDDTPFFELILPPRLAKRAIPLFAMVTWAGFGFVTIRFVMATLR